MTLLDPVDNVDDILRRTRVLLVPSLWAEARSRMVVESMLRGVPVIASNVGGIPEAKLGVDYLSSGRIRPGSKKYRAGIDLIRWCRSPGRTGAGHRAVGRGAGRGF